MQTAARQSWWGVGGGAEARMWASLKCNVQAWSGRCAEAVKQQPNLILSRVALLSLVREAIDRGRGPYEDAVMPECGSREALFPQFTRR